VAAEEKLGCVVGGGSDIVKGGVVIRGRCGRFTSSSYLHLLYLFCNSPRPYLGTFGRAWLLFALVLVLTPRGNAQMGREGLHTLYNRDYVRRHQIKEFSPAFTFKEIDGTDPFIYFAIILVKWSEN